jgi:hypothetical protein
VTYFFIFMNLWVYRIMRIFFPVVLCAACAVYTSKKNTSNCIWVPKRADDPPD